MVRLEYAYGVCPKCKVNNYLRYIIHNDGLVHKPYEIKCINCNSYFKKEDIFGSGEETTPKPMTNADRIRSMKDEELAEFMVEFMIDKCKDRKCQLPPLLGMPFENYVIQSQCKKCWIDWLRQEADNGQN